LPAGSALGGSNDRRFSRVLPERTSGGKEKERLRIQAQNAAIRHLAGIFLEIRDRMNTPLQVIELSVEVLRNSRDPTDQILDRIERSVES
jgi:hypothetical protein